ncbi:MAG: hypothetical protein KC549_05210 [Myxococcales bacterium]|nr:hypothetical protein [Myxococcales bacterium]MCB9545591.1 hypothetical protein [Myxococcales bacterium]
MKKGSLLLLGLSLAASPGLAEPLRFGLAGGIFLPTRVEVGDRTADARPGPILAITLDVPVAAALDVGAFVLAGGFEAGERTTDTVRTFETGVGAHYRLPLGAGLLRAGLQLGYRRLAADLPAYDRSHGVALNLDAEYSRRLYRALHFQVRLSLLSQPMGGNSDHRVLMAPSPVLAVGVVL